MRYDFDMQPEAMETTRVLRTAAWIWLGYLAALAVMDAFIYAHRPSTAAVLGYHLWNAAPALVFWGLAQFPWAAGRARLRVPLMIVLLAVVPMLVSQIVGLRLPPAPLSNLEGLVLRQLPLLFLGLVLVAWHYSLGLTVLYSLLTYGLEVALVTLWVPFEAERQSAFYFIATIRTVSLIVVGIFINQLIRRLRTQHAALQAAHAELARQAHTLEQLTISRERNRLARELHDTLAHSLTALAVTLETAKAYFEIDPPSTRVLLEKALTATRAGLDETRRALKALRASALEDLGLRLALQHLAETAAARGRLQLTLALPDQLPPLAPEVEQSLYRIAQEALENVVNHAQAEQLTVQLTSHPPHLTLLIQDNGCGTDLQRASPLGHFGLAGMRERAKLIGGTLTLHSTRGAGMQVQFTV